MGFYISIMKHLVPPALIAFSLAPLHAPAQVPYLDSLWTLWRDTANHDTIRLRAMHLIAWDGHLFTQLERAFYFAQLEYEPARTKGREKEMVNAPHVQGISC